MSNEARRREDADIETAGEGYAARFAGATGRWLLDVQEREARRLLSDLPAGSRILDLGGGHGQLVPVLLEAGARPCVAGSSLEAGRRLRRGGFGDRVLFEVVELARLPHPDRSFDLVVCIRLLPHLHNWRALLAEICRVARGSVVVDYPSLRSVNRWADPLFGWKKRVEKNTRPFTLFRPLEIRDAFAGSGFRVVRESPEFFWPMALHRLIGLPALSIAMESPARWVGLTRLLGSPVLVRADRIEAVRGDAPA